MTVFCYKDGMMAADTAVFDNHEIMVGERDKIVRGLDSSIAAACGPSHKVDSFRRVMERSGSKYIATKDLNEVEGLIVRQNGSMHVLRDTHLIEIRCPFFAGGAAWQIALGAMAAGASAEEAVRIAIVHHHHAGGTVQTMKLLEDGTS